MYCEKDDILQRTVGERRGSTLVETTPNPPRQLYVSDHHCNSLCVNRAEIAKRGEMKGYGRKNIRIFKYARQIGFCGALQRFNSGHRPAKMLPRKVLCGFLHLRVSIQTGKPTRRAKGSLRMRSSVEFWYFRISLKAFVPGRKRFFLPLERALSILTGWGAFWAMGFTLVPFST